MKQIDQVLLTRLEICVQRTGSKKALATATQISLPQLFRYLKGETVLPSDRLTAIAHAANVHPYWLLTGEGAPDLPPIKAFASTEDGISLDSHSLTECLQLADSIDRDYQFHMTPTLKAEFAVALYQAIYLESRLYDRPMKFESSKALEVFAYVSSIQGEIPRKMILNTIDILDSISKSKIPEKEVRTFTNYLVTAMRDLYNHPTIGQPYFDRIGYTLEADTAAFVDYQLKEVKQSFLYANKIEMLDLGCGNGRHLLHFAKSSLFKLHATDNVELSKKICLAYEEAGKLPRGTYTEADMRNLPYPDNSFDLIFSNASIFHVPYFPHSPHGLHAVFKEMLRVLKPKGYIYIHARHGNGYEPFPFFQLHNEGSIRQIAHHFGLQVKRFERIHIQDSVECIPKTLFNEWFSALLRKP
jgi:SAM-dependent methyltransferase